MANYSLVYSDGVDLRKKAIKALEKYKGSEKLDKRFLWRLGGTEISHTSLVRLKAIVEEIGYDWDKGTIISPTEQCDTE